MEKLLLRKIVVIASVIAIVLIGFAPMVSAKPAKPQTVVDYFMLLPSRNYFNVETLSQRKRLLSDNGSVVDIKNDYIFIKGGDSQPSLCVALFRHRGRVLIAILDGGYDPAIPSLHLLHYGNGVWKDVTKKFSPLRFNPNYIYKLPRYGTTVEVINKKGEKVYDWVWVNGKFKTKRG